MLFQAQIDTVKLEIYVPKEYIEELRDELALVGVCQVGNYSHVVSYQESEGYWKPLEGSNPYNGEKGKICSGKEVKMEVICPIEKVQKALEVVKNKHPYEEPLINVIPLLSF